MNTKLVFDIGIHKGEDTSFYLKKGFKVVAVDANPILIQANEQKFKNEIISGQLTLINTAISCSSNEILKFHVSHQSEWSSLHYGIANRFSNFDKTINIKSTTLADLIDQFGLPYYCKIDIEGQDLNAIKSLNKNHKPKIISVESECSEKHNTIIYDSIEMLDELVSIGYTKFKIIDQFSIKSVSLPIKKSFQFNGKLSQKLKIFYYKFHFNKLLLFYKFCHFFQFGSSGPFGDDIDGKWQNSNATKALFEDLIKIKPQGRNIFWYDIHATY